MQKRTSHKSKQSIRIAFARMLTSIACTGIIGSTICQPARACDQCQASSASDSCDACSDCNNTRSRYKPFSVLQLSGIIDRIDSAADSFERRMVGSSGNYACDCTSGACNSPMYLHASSLWDSYTPQISSIPGSSALPSGEARQSKTTQMTRALAKPDSAVQNDSNPFIDDSETPAQNTGLPEIPQLKSLKVCRNRITKTIHSKMIHRLRTRHIQIR